MTYLRPTLKHLPRILRPTSVRAHSTSVSENELSHFSSLASSWWDPMGPSRILHLMNPLRHEFISSCLVEGPPSPSSSQPNNLRYLDVGCGGGIFAESLARTIPSPSSSSSSSSVPSSLATPTRAASITAIDPTPTLIQIAREHARTDPAIAAHLSSGRFKYQNCTLEDMVRSASMSMQEKEMKKESFTSSAAGGTGHPTLPESESQFDVVTLFEVLEHIDTNASSAPLKFLADCLRLLRPGGWLVGSTISRSFPSFVINQVIAEAPWPIGVVPRGTHDWVKFVNPDELLAWLQEGLVRSADATDKDVCREMQWKCSGVMYFPGLGWKLVGGSEDWGNYFWAVRKGE
ncbi:hypothetical protein EYZ11_012348 [Aspergillus tanneri]|uniref:Ubiquinone biosynthesis O-methyltransferase, mitochondrial n=1 Tax=Aspergillus tanneri TaxID=1220188 RepID=A0A4V3UMQ6_9EURO|nr:Hexaprenyldihydroxybenzoate methyltransferase, mitochondrial [Aspergillus tanneri]KAA8648792.1 Hexaprenyldihydroxybenzoate methyltransferase, mitochondrial [Aspergillus tanneri]THC88204.1 hypothetical protein EYZ11_012348 [Aspergillus tanneri]